MCLLFFFSDITVIENLDVGSHFSDHIQVYGLVFASNLSEPTKTLRENIIDYLNGVGFLAQAVSSQGVLYFQTSLETTPNYPDMEITIADGSATDWGLTTFQRWRPEITKATSKPNGTSSFQLFVTPLRTLSLGTIRLSSSDPYEYPTIDPNVLSDRNGHDRDVVYEGIQFALNLVSNSDAFKRINASFVMKPLESCSEYEFLSKDYWYCAMKYITSHNNHPVSTSRMGPYPENGDVVDSQLRVYGVGKLRVADASIIPLSTSSHINAICIMIGEKAADIIKKSY